MRVRCMVAHLLLQKHLVTVEDIDRMLSYENLSVQIIGIRSIASIRNVIEADEHTHFTASPRPTEVDTRRFGRTHTEPAWSEDTITWHRIDSGSQGQNGPVGIRIEKCKALFIQFLSPLTKMKSFLRAASYNRKFAIVKYDVFQQNTSNILFFKQLININRNFWEIKLNIRRGVKFG